MVIDFLLDNCIKYNKLVTKCANKCNQALQGACSRYATDMLRIHYSNATLELHNKQFSYIYLKHLNNRVLQKLM